MMQPIIIRLPEEKKQLLQIEARSQGVAVSKIARKAISNFLESRQKRSAVKTLLEWATRKEKVRKKAHFNSGNYKEYLYGKKSKRFGRLWSVKNDL